MATICWSFFFFMTNISPCCVCSWCFSLKTKYFLEEPASGVLRQGVMVLSRDLCISEGETLQGKTPWIWAGIWDLNDFNTGFEIKFRTTETPHPLMAQFVWGWQYTAIHILLAAHCVWQVHSSHCQVRARTGKGQCLRHRNTCMWVVTRKVLLCIYQLSKTRAPCHHFKIFLYHLHECVNLFFSLRHPLQSTWTSNEDGRNSLLCLSSPHSLAAQTGLPSSHLGLWRAPLRQRPPEDMPVYRWAQGHPRHPSSPSCQSPLRQLHFLLGSLGTNSCIPASSQSQGEAGLC